MVVIPNDVPESRNRSCLAYAVLIDTGVAADVLVWRQSAFQQREQLKISLLATVIEEGNLLYAS